jgi:glycosyltransferase involved in cell wall biosynthesis
MGKPSLFLAANFLSQAGGQRAVMEDLAERLAAAGYPLFRASPFRSGLTRGAHMAAAALFKLRDYDVSVVDLYSGRAFLWGETVCRISKLLGKATLLILRGGGLPELARRDPERVRKVLASASVCAVPSRFLLEEMGRYREDLLLIPNPIDLAAYAFRPRDRPGPRLIWMRAFHEIYNPTLAPRVLALLSKQFPEATLAMIGPDKGDGSLESVRRTAADLRVQDRLSLPGGITKSAVPEWLDKGDIFLNTTNVDNTPVSILEAMASGLCVISTRVGGIPYLLGDGREALLVPPEDADAMANAARRVMVETNLAGRLSRGGRALAERFDWPAILPLWESALREADDRVLRRRRVSGRSPA